MKNIMNKWKKLSNETKELIYMTIFTWVFIVVLWFIAFPLSVIMMCVGCIYLNLVWDTLRNSSNSCDCEHKYKHVNYYCGSQHVGYGRVCEKCGNKINDEMFYF